MIKIVIPKYGITQQILYKNKLKREKMKKTFVCIAMAMGVVLMSGCGGVGGSTPSSSTSSSSASTGGGVLGSILGAATNGETIGNVLTSVLGIDKLSQKNLVGTWKYKGPGCAFTSTNTLAKAGGEVAATQIKEKLASQYSKLGFNSSNTYITFNEDGTFSAKIDGKSMSGKYTYDASTAQVKLSGMLLNFTAYAKRNTDGIGILFESKKILTLIQTMASMSSNETIGAIGNISKNYDGVRVGFDLTK